MVDVASRFTIPQGSDLKSLKCMQSDSGRREGGGAGEGAAIALHSQTHINIWQNKEGPSSAVSDILHETIACITTGLVSHWGTISLVLLGHLARFSSQVLTQQHGLFTSTTELELHQRYFECPLSLYKQRQHTYFYEIINSPEY